MYHTFSIVLILTSGYLYGQEIKKTTNAYFQEVRSGKYNSIPKNLTLPENAKNTLTALSPFLRDTSTVVRAKAYAIVQLAGSYSRESTVREDAVTKLVEAIKDKDSGNVGLALGYLTEFYLPDFTPAAKDTLVNIFRRKSPHFDELIKLIGFLQLTQVRDDLRALSQNSSALRKDRWTALLALARMGDSYATDNVMTRIQKLPVNDDVVYQIYPDLIYTRQRAPFEVLLKALNSDDKNCESANAESEAKIPCAYRVMEMIAPAIQGYPLKLDESGDIDAKNYAEALVMVRDWFKSNKNYTIATDKY